MKLRHFCHKLEFPSSKLVEFRNSTQFRGPREILINFHGSCRIIGKVDIFLEKMTKVKKNLFSILCKTHHWYMGEIGIKVVCSFKNLIISIDNRLKCNENETFWP